MGIQADINKNEFLKDIRDSALAQGEARGEARGLKRGRVEGRVEGRREGRSIFLMTQFKTKFGPIPGWAKDRIARGTAAQAQRWARKLLRAQTLEEVLGPKR